jgi:ribosomal protein S18 acetylase RimI-like enzyme
VPNFSLAEQKDLINIAQCHKLTFPKSLTSKMGVGYLTKIFSWYLSTDKAFLFYLQNQSQVIGYVGGMIVDGTLMHGSASSLTQHTFNDAIKALILRPWLFLHPDFLSRYSLFTRNVITRLRNKFRRQEVRSAVAPVEPYAGLVVIGVDPTHQGKGYGSLLLQEFEKITVEKDIRKMMLTVKSTNNKAINSYKRNGWSIVNFDTKSVSMSKEIH